MGIKITNGIHLHHLPWNIKLPGNCVIFNRVTLVTLEKVKSLYVMLLHIIVLPLNERIKCSISL